MKKSKHRHISNEELKRKYNYYSRKIEKLWRDRQRTEAILYMSILIEFFIKESILGFEKIIQAVALDAHVDFKPRNLYTKKDIENQPMGYLIRILDIYTEDKNLIKSLTHFSQIRNDFVHNLLYHEIKFINKQLEGVDKLFFELMVKLLSLNINQIEFLETNFHFVCDSCFKETLSNHVKF